MPTFTAGQILAAAQMNTQAGDTGWIRVAGGVGFQNSWSEFAPIFVSYRLLGQVVDLKGMLYGGPSGSTTAFTLPVGYRPAQLLTFAVLDYTTGAPKRIQIDTTGTVTPQTASDLQSLDGICFPIN